MDSRLFPEGSGALKSRYVDGSLVFFTPAGVEIYRINPSTGVLTYASGSSVNLASSTVTLPAASVTAAMLANGATLSAVIAASLAASGAYPKTDVATNTLLAANATKARGVLVILTVTETYAANTGTAPTVKVGEDDTIEKGIAAATVATKTAGTVLVAGFSNIATKKIIVTTTAAVGDATGACSVTVIALPNS